MDPQQRLVLELAWEALEDARDRARRARGRSRTGVFVGAIAGDYAQLLDRRGRRRSGRHTLTGLHRSIIANRVSYALGLRGPSLTVDAAQSSSLVAVHLACESLRRGESTLALAGGVNLNLDPRGALRRRAGSAALSPDGRCFTFDARANGYVRGEGGGVVVLKPLAAALADGDRVYCVIRGSAVNNDGGGDGLTAPSRAAQEERHAAAYRQRRGATRPTSSTSSCTAPAPRSATRSRRPRWAPCWARAEPADEPLLVGSVKTNVGHLEGAAGIVGLIKAALAIEHRRDPGEPQLPSAPTRRSRWTSWACGCRRSWGPGRTPAARCWPGSARSAWAAPTATWSSPISRLTIRGVGE